MEWIAVGIFAGWVVWRINDLTKTLARTIDVVDKISKEIKK